MLAGDVGSWMCDSQMIAGQACSGMSLSDSWQCSTIVDMSLQGSSLMTRRSGMRDILTGASLGEGGEGGGGG